MDRRWDVAVLRTLLGEALRTTRLRQHRTLREVSTAARVSLGYLSEVERGHKEASSELLASICRALGVRLSDVLREVSETLSVLEPAPVPLPAVDTVSGTVPGLVPDTVPGLVPEPLPALEPVGADERGAAGLPVAVPRSAAVARTAASDVVAAA
jgi:transcriptional regulator with XRE-family HTH domain